MAKGALKFRNLTLPRQANELGRLRVLGGPDAGTLFVVVAPKVSLGRGEENEIVLADLKMSRRHADLIKLPQGIMVQDLGSSNGVAVNGQPIKQWVLRSGDKIGVGGTVLEYLGPEASESLMTVAPPTNKNLGEGQSGLTQFLKIPQWNGLAPQSNEGTAGLSSATDRTAQNKRLLGIITTLIAIAAMLPQAEQKMKSAKRRYEVPEELSEKSSILKRFLPTSGDTEAVKKAEFYFREGYREFTERNYVRARANFDLALQIHPDHEMARVYMSRVEKSISEDAKKFKANAKRDEDSGRYPAALNGYDSIRRLYFRDQSNPVYKEADSSYQRVEKAMTDLKERKR